VQHGRGLHAGTRATKYTVRITDKGAGATAYTSKVQALPDSQGKEQKLIRSKRRAKCRMQADGGERTGIRLPWRLVPARTTPSTATHKGCYDTEMKDCESHKIKYIRMGFETLIFFRPGIGGPSRGYSLSYVNSGITVAYIAASSTTEPNNARKRAPDGTGPVSKFTAP